MATYIVTINGYTEQIKATEIKFDDGGGIQFYQLVVDKENPNSPYKILVKAFAAGNWQTVIDQSLDGKTCVEYVHDQRTT